MERGVMTWVVVGSERRKTERWLIGGGGVEWGKVPWRNGRFGFTLRSRYRLSDDERRGPSFLLMGGV